MNSEQKLTSYSRTGSLNPDNGRTPCPGGGSESCTTAAGEVVQTFNFYLLQATRLMMSKGATVVLSSMTPNNVWETGTYSYSPSRFTRYARNVASVTDSTFVDHGAYTAEIYRIQGKAKVDGYFPNDHTHTSLAGAETVARTFVKGLLCAGERKGLGAFVNDKGLSAEGSCL